MNISDLAGAWRLLSFEYRSDDGEVLAPFGPDPDGILIYDASGTMSGMMSQSGRPPLPSENYGHLTEKEKASLGDGYIGYAGTYEVKGDRIIHHVQVSFLPNWVGMDLVRAFTFEQGTLTLRTDPPIEHNGRKFAAYMTWKRHLQPGEI